MFSRYERVAGYWTAPCSPSSPNSAIYYYPVGSPSSLPANFYDRCNSAPIYQSTPIDQPFFEPVTPINNLSTVFEVGDQTLMAAADEVEEAEEIRLALEAFFWDEYRQRYPTPPSNAINTTPVFCRAATPERRRAIKRKLDF